ncbi:MAG: GIY-YIG nuclease family protein [Patescibacteria group bacterium]|nr:GIY-YIG nuclease family protein [Patescibacteria group bacterium]
MYFVYMIRNSASKLYVGVTNNPQQRLAHHNARRGAQFTRRIPTFEIVFLEQYEALADARKREIQIKKWRCGKKEMLIERYQEGLETKNPE